MSDTTNTTGQAPQGGARVSEENPSSASPASAPLASQEASAAPPTSTQDVIAARATNPQQAAAVQNLSSSIKSLKGVTVQAERAASASPEAKVGALVALKAAKKHHGQRFKEAVEAFGDTVARAIKEELGILHGLDHQKVEDAEGVLTPPQNDITS